MKELILKLIKEKKENKTFEFFCIKRGCINCTIGKIRGLENSKFKHTECYIVYNNIEKEAKSNIYKY